MEDVAFKLSQMTISIHNANINDREGAKLLLERVKYKYQRLIKI